MSERQIFILLHGLWNDLNYPEFYWELVGLALILLVSWWVTFRFRRRTSPLPRLGGEGNQLRAFGAGGLKRIAFPLIALTLVFLTRRLLIGQQVEHLSVFSLAVPLILSWTAVRVFVYVLRCVFSHGGLLTSFERVITAAIWIWMVLDLSGFADPGIEMLEQIEFHLGKQKIDLWMLIHGSVTVGVMLLVALWIASLIESRLQAAAQLDANLREVLVRVAKAVLSIIALLGSLSLVGIDVTALSVFSGALAVGLGFGLQKIASNYVSGFIILLDRSIRLGNLVTVDQNVSGTVAQITTRYTVLKMLNGTDVIIPNEYLVNNIVRNQSFTDTRVRIGVPIQVAYGTDLEKAMALMVEAAKAQPRVLADPEPGVQLVEFAASGINLEIGFWMNDPEQGTGGVRSDINLAIWRAFRANAIEIPFPQCEVRLIGGALPSIEESRSA